MGNKKFYFDVCVLKFLIYIYIYYKGGLNLILKDALHSWQKEKCDGKYYLNNFKYEMKLRKQFYFKQT